MIISGIQQIGVGVPDVHAAFKWYRTFLGADVPIFEEAATAGLMLPYTGGEPRERHAILAANLQGGGALEIWQYTQRVPMPAEFEIQLGDLGINVAKFKCKNVQACFNELRNQGVHMLTNVSNSPDGREHFYVKDPWGNPLEIVGSENWFNRKLKHQTGGVYGCSFGVTNMARSIEFYRNILGYDQVVYDHTDTFDDFKGMEGGFQRYRRVLLRHSASRKGAFSRLFGETEIELLQALDRAPRKIFENRFWGDLGFIHLCFDITGMETLKKTCADYGHPFTVDSSGSFDMGEAAGYFSYIEDPDGTLIEFVETHKLPIMKKLGWYLDLRKRSDRSKPLPDWMIRALSFGRVK